MEWQYSLILILGLFVLFMMLGLPVAFSLLLTAGIGALIYWRGQAGLEHLQFSMIKAISRFVFLPIPLFMLMGELLANSGIALRFLNVVDQWLGHLPGRLSLVAVGTGLIISTLTGVGSATIAILGTELVPEMEKRGYKKEMSLGPILGSSTLATMIPPSGLAVIVAALGEISVGKLLMAIIIPGIIMATVYAIYIIMRCRIQPALAPSYETPSIPLGKKITETANSILPVAVVIFLVTGVIFFGIATPTEAAATGVIGVVIMALYYRKLTWQVIKTSLIGTTKISVMVFLIIAAAQCFSDILSFSGVSKGLAEWVLNISVVQIWSVVFILILMLIVGMFMPVIAMATVILAIITPIIRSFGLSDVWFGVLILITMEVAVISPPYGTDLFIMKHVAPSNTTMRDVYLASIPFCIMDIIILFAITFFPPLALWLPGLMK